MVLFQNGQKLFTDTRVADTFWKRFFGLMGQRKVRPDEALLITKCSRIHTCFMRFTIDVAYVDANFKVLLCETVKPWRIGRYVKGAKHVVEIAEGKAKVFKIGFPVQIGITEREYYDE